MINIKMPSKINISLFFIFPLLIFAHLSHADSRVNTINKSLDNMLSTQTTDSQTDLSNTQKSNQKKVPVKDEPIKDKIIVAYTIDIPKFTPSTIPQIYPSKSQIANRITQTTDEIKALAKTTEKLYNQTIKNQNQNNQIYTQYRKIIDSVNATLDTGHSLPGDPELTQKINVSYQLLESIKHNLATLQTLNMGVRQQADINDFLVTSIKRTQNIEVANNNDQLNLKHLAKIIAHNSLYLKYFRKNFQDIMKKHQLLISKITSELSRVNAGVIAGKSVKVIFQEHQGKMGQITLTPMKFKIAMNLGV